MWNTFVFYEICWNNHYFRSCKSCAAIFILGQQYSWNFQNWQCPESHYGESDNFTVHNTADQGYLVYTKLKVLFGKVLVVKTYVYLTCHFEEEDSSNSIEYKRSSYVSLEKKYFAKRIQTIRNTFALVSIRTS